MWLSVLNFPDLMSAGGHFPLAGQSCSLSVSLWKGPPRAWAIDAFSSAPAVPTAEAQDAAQSSFSHRVDSQVSSLKSQFSFLIPFEPISLISLAFFSHLPWDTKRDGL